jgi:hypothetical protein
LSAGIGDTLNKCTFVRWPKADKGAFNLATKPQRAPTAASPCKKAVRASVFVASESPEDTSWLK